jgi:hypothetical protein
MTPFERVSIALIHHIFVNEINSPSDKLTSTRRKIAYSSGRLERLFSIREISWNKIEFDGGRPEEGHKVWSDGTVEKKYTKIKTEDQPYHLIYVENIDSRSMSGQVRGFRFKSEVKGYGKITITDDEKGGKSFSYVTR